MKRLILVLAFVVMFTPYANADSLFGVDRIEDELVNLDMMTGEGTVVGSTAIPHVPEDFGLALENLAYDPLLNVFYAIDNNQVDGGMHLLKYDPETWDGQVIGALGTSLRVLGLAFDPVNRILYGVEASGNPFNDLPNLISIDINTGSMTHLGDLDIPRNNPFFSLAYSVSGNVLYASDELSGINGSSIYEINPSNANISLIGAIGFPGQMITGLAYDNDSEVLYGSSDTYLFSIDTQTGAGTIIGAHNQTEITGLALVTPIPEPPPAYTVIDLGIPEGDYTGTSARGINESGQVVGKVYSMDHPNSNDDHTIAFVWDTTNSLQLLATLGGRWDEAWDINDLGQIVGEATDSSGGNHAVIWENGEVFDLGGATSGRANAINNAGKVVGWFGSLAGGGPFIYDITTDEMEFPFGSGYTYPWDINDNGQVTGHANDASGQSQAFIWDDTNGKQFLSWPTGYTGANAHAINNSGHIAGEVGPGDHAVIWYDINSVERLYDEDLYARTYGINELGQIVGSVSSGGFLWDSENGMQYLIDLVYPYEGLESINWAADINNSGQIAANATINGRLHAVLLTPILEPLTHCVSTPEELQSALTNAANNFRDDIIQIVQGTYNGNFVYDSTQANSLTIEGGFTDDCTDRVDPSNTVLDGGGSGRVLELNAPSVAADFVVDGVTLQNGYATAGYKGGGLYVSTAGNTTVRISVLDNNSTNNDQGGGAYIQGSMFVHFDSNIITNNIANIISGNSNGGGLYIDNSSSVLMQNNEIRNNRGEYGGGVFITAGNEITMVDNRITDNLGGGFSLITPTATISNNIISDNTNAKDGGGGFISGPVTAVVDSNIFSNNSCDIEPCYGGGLGFLYSDTVELTRNIFKYNASKALGGGVGFGQARIVILNNNIISYNNAKNGGGVGFGVGTVQSLLRETMTNNTIANNSATEYGGGIYLYSDNDTQIADFFNNIIYNNNSLQGSDLYINNDGNNNYIPSTVNLYNNDLDQSEEGTYIQDWSTVDSGGNLNNVDPLFVDPTNEDFHLTLGSPCRDAGIEPDFGLPPTDFEGDPRIYGPAPDIGADEVTYVDTDGDGVPDDVDECPASDLSPTVVIDGCDSGVTNTLFDDGCTISDNITELANSSTSHGKFTSAVAHYTNDLKKDGEISGKQKGAIQSCAGQAGTP